MAPETICAGTLRLLRDPNRVTGSAARRNSMPSNASTAT
jgi:hypothetical protein